MRPGDEILITPTELVAGGDALARVEGLPIFTPGIFPGDEAAVRITEAKKGFARAELIRVITPSPLRRSEPCPIAGECGGCDWTALRLDAQLDAKRRILTESLRRIGKFDPATLPPISMHSSPLNYRLRSRLHRDGDAVGFYAMRSNRVVPLAKECEVVGVKTARRFGCHPEPVRLPLASLGVAQDRRSEGSGGTGATENQPRATQTPRFLANARNDMPDIWEIDGELITDDREMTITVDRYKYALSTSAFFQVNRHLLTTLLRLVVKNASRTSKRDVAIDLYAGVGFFSLPLTELFDRVIAVEGSSISSTFARRNLPPKAMVISSAVEEALDDLPRAPLIFLDPPRAGARREVIETVGQRAQEVICYLSCDPVTFARDAHRLSASGWQLLSLDLVDLFPNTHHVETLSSFGRAR